MTNFESSKFNKIIREIIKKSLFTEKQIQIILNLKKIHASSYTISRGAYYRQVGQSRNKLARLYYSIILLKGLGVLNPKDDDVISRLSEQIRVIRDSDIFPEREEQIMDVIEKLIHQEVRT